MVSIFEGHRLRGKVGCRDREDKKKTEKAASTQR
jgi:hypothetical protein